MDAAVDAELVAASLADWLGRLAFTDRGTDEVTTLLIESVMAWARGQGWRVYPRAPSVMPMPPPYSQRHSFLDVACARPVGPPIAIEIDRSDRQRTIDKLLAEAEAGRLPVWVRWGTGRFEAPPPPVRMVTCQVSSRRGLAGKDRLFSRVPVSERPAPAHSLDDVTAGDAMALPFPRSHSLVDIRHSDDEPNSGPVPRPEPSRERAEHASTDEERGDGPS